MKSLIISILKKLLKAKYAVVFFYPLDFTFVCPSELIAFDHRLADFKAKNVEVIGVSIDSHFTHAAWRNTPVNQRRIGQVGYPLVEILNMKFAKALVLKLLVVLHTTVHS